MYLKPSYRFMSIYIKMYFPFDIRLGDDKTIKHVIINNVNKYSHICYAYSTSTYETTKHNQRVSTSLTNLSILYFLRCSKRLSKFYPALSCSKKGAAFFFAPKETSNFAISINIDDRPIENIIINLVNICVNASLLIGEIPTISLAVADPEFPLISYKI